MGETYKVLGQEALPATTLTDVYTVPASTAAVVSTITIANRSAATKTFRLSVAVGGAADDNEQYLFWDVDILANDTFALTFGMTLAATDVIRAYASTADLTVVVFGSELDV